MRGRLSLPSMISASKSLEFEAEPQKQCVPRRSLGTRQTSPRANAPPLSKGGQGGSRCSSCAGPGCLLIRECERSEPPDLFWWVGCACRCGTFDKSTDEQSRALRGSPANRTSIRLLTLKPPT